MGHHRLRHPGPVAEAFPDRYVLEAVRRRSYAYHRTEYVASHIREDAGFLLCPAADAGAGSRDDQSLAGSFSHGIMGHACHWGPP